jgi:hypothetical protein
MSEKSAVDGQLRLGLRSFLVRSRRGSVAGGALHLFFCVCWVFQGRITLGWRGLSMATSRWVSVYSCYGGPPIAARMAGNTEVGSRVARLNFLTDGSLVTR